MLKRASLVVEFRRRGQAHTYIPHMLGTPAEIPDNLWKNGWIRHLPGPELFILIWLLHAGEGFWGC